MQSPELDARVFSAQATLHELEEFFGPDAMNHMARQWRGKSETDRAFWSWYSAVLEPIGLDSDAAYQMFVGATSIRDYAGADSRDESHRFVELYEGLQITYVAELHLRGGV